VRSGVCEFASHYSPTATPSHTLSHSAASALTGSSFTLAGLLPFVIMTFFSVTALPSHSSPPTHIDSFTAAVVDSLTLFAGQGVHTHGVLQRRAAAIPAFLPVSYLPVYSSTCSTV